MSQFHGNVRVAALVGTAAAPPDATREEGASSEESFCGKEWSLASDCPRSSDSAVDGDC